MLNRFRGFVFFSCFVIMGVVPFAQGAETIYYSIRQIGFDKASLTFEGDKDYKGHKTVLVVFKGRGSKYWDEEDIYLEPSTYKPLFVERYFNLGLWGHAKITEEYRPKEIIITKTEKGKHVTRQVIRKSVPIDNIYGFIDRYRKEGSFRVGDVIKMNLPTKDLKFRLVGRVPLKIGDKTYDSYMMQSQPAQYKIWFDASEHKWPLRISGSVGLLSSVMTMTGHDEKSDSDIKISK